MVVRRHFRAVLDDADLFDFREYPQFFQHRERMKEQRFADVKARVRILFQYMHVPPSLRQEGRNGRTGGGRPLPPGHRM